MKKKIKFLFLLLLFLGAVYYLVMKIPVAPTDQNDLKILLIENDGPEGKYAHIVEVYKSVLEEEGVPFAFKPPTFLLPYNPAEIVKTFPVIIFGDGIAQSLPPDIGEWIQEYMKYGGSVAIIYDAGTKDMKHNYLDKSIFMEVTGIDYILYNRLNNSENAYTTSYVRFENKKSADFFQITPGKIDEKFYINGYSYGQLTFPVARARVINPLKPGELYASAVTEGNEVFPVLVLKKFLSGNLLYVNLPLGHIKSNSDDFLIRSILRTFLFNVVKIPHLMSTPGGKGGMVLNWHIDWDNDWAGLTYMLENGFFTPHIRHSIHNTAGEFTDRPGDGVGFDACGKGRRYLEAAIKHGTLGSHGGWAHNWFYENILNGNFGPTEIEKYIVKNSNCLRSIAGYPIIEYSAPNGVHPQPMLTSILEKNGFIAYYYTGDTGSGPNRTFYEKKMVSKSVIAFPVNIYHETASLYEMNRDKIQGSTLAQWWADLLDFVEKNKTVRLWYSHSYDVAPYYPAELKHFIESVDQKAAEGKIHAQPMSFFAKFLLRFLKTGYRFSIQPNGLDIRLNNPEGLAGITLALPKDKYKKTNLRNLTIIDEDSNYYYLEIGEPGNETLIHIDTLNP